MLNGPNKLNYSCNPRSTRKLLKAEERIPVFFSFSPSGCFRISFEILGVLQGRIFWLQYLFYLILDLSRKLGISLWGFLPAPNPLSLFPSFTLHHSSLNSLSFSSHIRPHPPPISSFYLLIGGQRHRI